jgi:HEAT repeat protein
MNIPDYSPAIRSMLRDRDLNALVTALRSPSDAGLRTQAARALGELGDIDATESLIRSVLEDPDSFVQAAARQSLQELHGNRSDLIIASYRGGKPELAEWLVEPDEEDPDLFNREDNHLSEVDIDGLLMVVSQESNPAIREKAIRALEHIHDTRSTDMLAFLALHGDNSSIRSAAMEVLQAHFGDQAAEILRAADANSDEDAEWSDEEGEALTEGDESEPDEEYEEDEVDEDLADDLDQDEFEAKGAWGLASAGRNQSDFPQGPSMASQRRGSPVMQEIGVSWRILVVVGLALLILAVILLLKP